MSTGEQGRAGPIGANNNTSNDTNNNNASTPVQQPQHQQHHQQQPPQQQQQSSQHQTSTFSPLPPEKTATATAPSEAQQLPQSSSTAASQAQQQPLPATAGLRRRSTLTSSIEQLAAAQSRRRLSHQSGPGRGPAGYAPGGGGSSIGGRSPMRSPPGPQAPPKPKFRPFTRSSLEAIKQRIRDAEDDARRSASASLPPEGADSQYHPSALLEQSTGGGGSSAIIGEPDPMLEAGLPLPRALQREFPDDLVATPIEDIDKYYQNKMVSLPFASIFILLANHSFLWSDFYCDQQRKRHLPVQCHKVDVDTGSIQSNPPSSHLHASPSTV